MAPYIVSIPISPLIIFPSSNLTQLSELSQFLHDLTTIHSLIHVSRIQSTFLTLSDQRVKTKSKGLGVRKT